MSINETIINTNNRDKRMSDSFEQFLHQLRDDCFKTDENNIEIKGFSRDNKEDLLSYLIQLKKDNESLRELNKKYANAYNSVINIFDKEKIFKKDKIYY